MESFSSLKSKFAGQSQLKKNVLSGTIFAVCNTVITLLAYPIYLEYLGAERYGLWSIVSVVIAFSRFGQMGIDTAITKYVANEYGRKNYKEITAYTSTSFHILLIPSLIIIVLLLVFKSQIAAFIKIDGILKDDGVRLILYVGFLSVFSFFVNVLKGVIVGIGRMDIANYSLLLSRLLQLVIAVILLVSDFGIWSLYYGFLIFYLVPLIIWMIILRNVYNIKIYKHAAVSRDKMRELLKYGGALVTGMTAQMFVVPFNKIIIGRYIGLSEVAYYQIAVSVVMSVRNLFVKGLESILPKFSEIYGRQKDSLKDVFLVHKKGMKFIYLFAFPLFIILFIFSDFILRNWLGDSFNVQITVVMRILVIGWLINALAVPDYYMFLGIGKVGFGVTATCLKSVTNLMLILLVILLNIDVTLNKVVVIDAISLVMAVIYLKIKYYQFKKNNQIIQYS